MDKPTSRNYLICVRLLVPCLGFVVRSIAQSSLLQWYEKSEVVQRWSSMGSLNILSRPK